MSIGPAMNTLRLEQHAESLQRDLAAEISGEVRFDKMTRAMYATDASVYQIMPLGVVLPRCRDDVIRTLRYCREHAVSITARGGGTSQAGQAIGAKCVHRWPIETSAAERIE